MSELLGAEPFASHFEYSSSTTVERTVMVDAENPKVAITTNECYKRAHKSTHPEQFPWVESMTIETETGTIQRWRPTDALCPTESKHVALDTRKMTCYTTDYRGEAYNLLLTRLKQGELTFYRKEFDGPDMRSARSVCEFLSSEIELPYRDVEGFKRGDDEIIKTRSYGPLLVEMPSEGQLRAMQMLFNGAFRSADDEPSPRTILQIVEAVATEDMARVSDLIDEYMAPFMEQTWAQIPRDEQDEEAVPLVPTVTEPSRRRVRARFTEAMKGASG